MGQARMAGAQPVFFNKVASHGARSTGMIIAVASGSVRELSFAEEVLLNWVVTHLVWLN